MINPPFNIEGLTNVGLNNPIVFGKAGEPVLQFPVAANRIGIVLPDGLNPIAAAIESGIQMKNYAMSGVTEFGKLKDFRD